MSLNPRKVTNPTITTNGAERKGSQNQAGTTRRIVTGTGNNSGRTVNNSGSGTNSPRIASSAGIHNRTSNIITHYHQNTNRISNVVAGTVPIGGNEAQNPSSGGTRTFRRTGPYPVFTKTTILASTLVNNTSNPNGTERSTRARASNQLRESVETRTRPPPPQVMTEASARRNRLTLVTSRRRTTLDISSTIVPSLNSSRSGRDNLLEENSETNDTNNLSNYVPFAATSRASRFHSRSRSRSRSPRLILSRRSRSRIGTKSSNSSQNLKLNCVQRVMGSEKLLTKLFRYFNWNELLPLRIVNKKWLETISSEPSTENRLGVITVKNPWEEKFELFNDSPVNWTKWRIHANIFIDMMDTIQLRFWMKHGAFITFLEIRNSSMTLSGLVEILSKCPNLEHFLVTWNSEMYSFNSELIKKYYGINFYNGNFANMQELCVEKSCYLTDNALWSLVKWCGGSLKSLSLTYPPENAQDTLTRLKPRWTIRPLIDYLERFGYTKNLQFLNFSWSNINPTDLKELSDTEHITALKGITLNHCKLDDDSVSYMLSKLGQKLRQLRLEDVPITEKAFAVVAGHNHGHTPYNTFFISLKLLKILDLSGPRGHFTTLDFLPNFPALVEFSARKTTWLDYSLLIKPLKAKNSLKAVTKLDLGGTQIKTNGSKHIDPNQNIIWFANLSSTLGYITYLNLDEWRQFGKNENFQMICQSMPLLTELRLRGWKSLGDSGVTGLSPEKLHQKNILPFGSRALKNRNFVGNLRYLSVLDLSGSCISDASIKYGVFFIPELRKFGFEDTEVSDSGLKMITHILQTIDYIMIDRCDKIVNPQVKYERYDGRFINVAQF